MANSKISALTSATTPLAGTEVLPIVQSSSTVKVSVDNLTKGRTVNATTFDTDVAAAGVTLSGTTLAADGTDAAININITPKGAGVVQTTASDAIVKFRVNTANAGVSASNYSQFELTDLGNIRTFWRSVRDGSGKTVFAYNDHLSVWANGATEVWRFTLDGNLAQYTAAKGINFTANTALAGKTSQLLNWYEEGTFTPTLTGSSTAITLTYTTQTGLYTRVGRLVTVMAYVKVNTVSVAGSGFLILNTSLWNSDGTPVSGSVTLGKVTYTSFASAQMRGSGSSSVVFYSSSTAGAPVIINATDVVSGSEIYVTITYIAA